jgi:glucose-6-phosphate 1-dehydrogenase
LATEAVEMVASRHQRPEEMDAYEKVLGDAMAGDATLFARQDYVEEAWRIVDPVLKSNAPVFEYEPGAWGPIEAAEKIAPPGDWHDPVITTGKRSTGRCTLHESKFAGEHAEIILEHRGAQ